MHNQVLPFHGITFSEPQLTDDGLFDSRLYRIKSDGPVVPSFEQAAENIRKALSLATALEVRVGSRWYFEAHELCCRLSAMAQARGVTLTVESSAGIVAALSPNESWDGNVRRATELVQTGATRGLGRDIGNATEILEGRSARDVLFAPEKENPKVRAFFSNIADPERSCEVTIDRHAIAMIRAEASPSTVPRLSLETYGLASDIMSRVAEEEAMLPHQLQAITWVTWRRLQGLGRVASDNGPDQLSLILD